MRTIVKRLMDFLLNTKAIYDRLLPIEDDGKLTDKTLRDHFLRKVFCYYDLKTNFMGCVNIAQMMEYHSKHRILLRMHNK